MGMGSPPCIKILASGEMDSSGWAFGAGEVGWLLLPSVVTANSLDKINDTLNMHTLIVLYIN